VVTVGVALALGAWTVTASSGSSSGSSSLSVQVKVDLNQALAGLASVGFRNAGKSGAVASGPSYHTDCAASATGSIKAFLERSPCKQYAIATRTITQKATTTRVAFSWVEMPTLDQAGQYKRDADTYRTGNSPGVALDFNGRCYASGQENATVWTIYVETTGEKNIDQKILQAAAHGRLSSRYLQVHCTE
jgi:hypothetical protein